MTKHPPSNPETQLTLAAADLVRLLDTGPMGYFASAADGTIERINTTLLEWLGYQRQDVVGIRTFQELLSAGGRIYYDTHFLPLLQLQNEVREIALEIVRSNGTRLPALINATLRPDADTGAPMVEAMIFDASRRREYEQQLLVERQNAERSESRLQLLYNVVSGLAAASTVDDAVDVITERGVQTADGSTCTVWLLEPGKASVRRAGHSRPDEGLSERLIFDGGGPALDELRAGRTVLITDRSSFEATYPLLYQWLGETGRESAVIAPLMVQGRLFGALAYGLDRPHQFTDTELLSVRSLATQAEQALNRAGLSEADQRSRARLESLFRFTTQLSGSVTLDDVIDVMTTSGRELLGADGVRVALLDDTGTMVRYAGGSGTGSELKSTIPIESGAIGCEVIRTGQIIVTVDREDLASKYPASPILAESGFGRVITAPLRRNSRNLGAWVLAFADEGPPDEDDLKVIRLFAVQASQAANRAASHQSEVVAREQSDLRRSISEALNRSATTAEIGQALTTHGRSAFGAESIAVFTVDQDDDASLQLIAQAGLAESTISGASVAAFSMPAASAAIESLMPVFADGHDGVASSLGPPFDSGRWVSAAVLPLVHAGEALGLAVVLFERDESLDSATRVALSGMAAEASIGLGRARQYELEHRVAITLQRSMLQSAIPHTPGWRMSVRYTPGSDHLLVGGDLFDITAVDDGRVFVVVGDVVGHGLQAAASMGQLRSAAKSLALVSSTPQQVLEGLDLFARLTPGVMHASVCCIVLEEDGSGRYACAGHPYPVLVAPDGTTVMLDQGRSPLLGLSSGETRPQAEFSIDEASTVVIYTDGLVERRHTSIEVGFDRLQEALAATDFSSSEPHATNLVRAIWSEHPPGDDIVVVCITRASEPNAHPSETTVVEPEQS